MYRHLSAVLGCIHQQRIFAELDVMLGNQLRFKCDFKKHVMKSDTCKQSEPVEIYGDIATQYGESEKWTV
jgi:hypothetical protein